MKLNKVKTLEGYTLDSLDGDIGKVKDFYFDDQYWAIRYLVVDTGNWLSFNQVLISPYALIAVDTIERNIAVSLSKKQIENSPSLNSDKPVSRQFEDAYYGYYGWPTYWGGQYMWGDTPNFTRMPTNWKASNQGGKAWDPHLRSTQHVSGYHIQAKDGEIGHVIDFIVDDDSWAIRYLVIDTKNWWAGKKVLISPRWIDSVGWSDSKIFVNMTRESIKQAPEYSDELLVTREYETNLNRHYKRPDYWAEDLIPKGRISNKSIKETAQI